MIDYPKIQTGGTVTVELVNWLWQLTELINRLEERIEVLERDKDPNR